MTDQTDRKSAEILAAMDKLAENGMPFIDVVKQGGFASFKPVGAKPIPLEPVQIHEDPGAAYWKEANDFMDKFDNSNADRIEQMAQEASRYGSTGALYSLYLRCPDVVAKFAALVAEDCARVVGYTYDAEAIRARYAIAKPPEAG